MNRLMLTWILFAAFPVASQAGVDVFHCKVLSLSEVSKEGTFVSGEKYQIEQIGATFSVERKTGEIRGNYFINNLNSESVRVINGLKDDDGFYVISESGRQWVNVSYLYIANGFDGLDKPFTYTSSGQYVYTGLCR